MKLAHDRAIMRALCVVLRAVHSLSATVSDALSYTSRRMSLVVLHSLHDNYLCAPHMFYEFDLTVQGETNCFANYFTCGLHIIAPLGYLPNQRTMPPRRMFHKHSLNYETFFKTPGTFHWVPALAIKRKNTYPLLEYIGGNGGVFNISLFLLQTHRELDRIADS